MIAQVRSPSKAIPEWVQGAFGSVANGHQTVRWTRTHRWQCNVASQQRA